MIAPATGLIITNQTLGDYSGLYLLRVSPRYAITDHIATSGI